MAAAGRNTGTRRQWWAGIEITQGYIASPDGVSMLEIEHMSISEKRHNITRYTWARRDRRKMVGENLQCKIVFVFVVRILRNPQYDS
jgi:hypothetical protein